MREDPDRIERLLALILLGQMKGATQREKIHQLNLGGFSNVEIADILGTSTQTVAQGLYEVKTRRTKPASKKSSSKKH